MARHPKGSTPKLTEELIEHIADQVRKGSYVETAVAFAGISRQTFYRWVKEAHDPECSPLLRLLSDTLERAQAEAEMRDLTVIDGVAHGQAAEYLMVPALDAHGASLKHPDGKLVMTPYLDGQGKPIKLRSEIHPNWQAAAWRLERRNRQRWGRTDQVMDPPVVQDSAPSREAIEARVKNLKRIKQVLDAIPEDSDLAEV